MGVHSTQCANTHKCQRFVTEPLAPVSGKSMRNVIEVIQGAVLGGSVFLILVFGLSQIASEADTKRVEAKVAEAVKQSAIQYPGAWDVNDRRGIDTYTDCIAIEAAILNSWGTLKEKFDAYVYVYDACLYRCTRTSLN